MYNDLGNNGEVFTNDAGQAIPNPEGYATKTEIALTREIFGDIAKILPDRFITKDNTDVPESYKLFKDNRKPIYQLKVDPNLTGSWLVPSHKEESSDTIGFWPQATKFPLTEQTIYPPDYSLRPPRRPTDVIFVNKDLKNMLESKITDKPNLNHIAFQEPKKPISFKGTTNSNMECLLNKCLTESYLAETFNDIALALYPFLFAEIESHIGDLKDKELPTFDLLYSLLQLAGQGNSRMSNLHISGLVANKLEMRDKILAEFDHPCKTKNILRGSGFLTENAFGPLPESLRQGLSSINGKDLMCKAKDTTSFNNTQANTRGGYNARPLSNQFFLTRGGARGQYVAAQTLKRTRNSNQNSTRGANNGSERGQGFRGRGRGARRNHGTK